MDKTPHPVRYSLSKKEIIRGKRVFDEIFEHGSTLRVGVLNFYYKLDSSPEPNSEPLMAGFSVPKRLFKKAVDRNLLKRRLREAYRLNKHFLRDGVQRNEKTLVFLVVYGYRGALPFQTIEAALVNGMKKMLQEVEKNK